MITEEPKVLPRRYEVRFKCSVGVYIYEGDLEIGDFVAVQCGKGYNIGVVSQAIPPDVEVALKESTKHQKILNKLTEDKAAIEQMLRNKVLAENNALSVCRAFCHTHRIGTFIDAIAAEFQFDRKKLTIHVMKTGDASVCKLVRKLFDTFKMRISILDIESVDLARQLAIEYLEITKLNLTLQEVFIDPSTFVSPLHHNSKGYRKSSYFKSQYTHGNTNPSLLSALQDYMPGNYPPAAPHVPHAHAMPAPPLPPPNYQELQDYRPYQSPYTRYQSSHTSVSRPPYSDHSEQQAYRSQVDYSYTYDHQHRQLSHPHPQYQSMSSIPPYHPSNYPRGHEYSPYSIPPHHIDDYGPHAAHAAAAPGDVGAGAGAGPGDDERYSSAKGVQGDYHSQEYIGDYPSYYPHHHQQAEIESNYSEHIPNEDIEQFDKSFDLSFRKLMIAPSLPTAEALPPSYGQSQTPSNYPSSTQSGDHQFMRHQNA